MGGPQHPVHRPRHPQRVVEVLPDVAAVGQIEGLVGPEAVVGEEAAPDVEVEALTTDLTQLRIGLDADHVPSTPRGG